MNKSGQAHMIRIPERPAGPRLRFVEDFVAARADATQLLAKSRGAPVRAVLGPLPVEYLRFVPVTCHDHAGRPVRTLTVEVTWTRQPLGGRRGWWRCSCCRRRCAVLLIADAQSPVACRRCWRAQYTSDYPRQQQQTRRRDVLLLAAGGSPALDRELQLLSAQRRRGVRRGRRVFQRAVRLLVKQHREIESAFPEDERRPS